MTTDLKVSIGLETFQNLNISVGRIGILIVLLLPGHLLLIDILLYVTFEGSPCHFVAGSLPLASRVLVDRPGGLFSFYLLRLHYKLLWFLLKFGILSLFTL